jgi:energy-coupling factor transport system substrate-specific component
MSSAHKNSPTRTAGSTEPGLARRPLLKYRTVDLVIAVAIGVVFGVVFLAWGQMYTLTEPLTLIFPPSSGLLTGVFFLPALVAALVVRRPGAALLAEVVAAVMETILGGQWGIGAFASGLLQGAGVELAFALTAYRKFTLPVAAAGAVVSAAFEWGWGYAFAYLGFFVVSAILLCAVLGMVIVRALAATGALNSFPPGREHAERALAERAPAAPTSA